MTNSSLVDKSQKISFIDRLIAGSILKLLPNAVRPNHITGFRFVMIPIVIAFILVENYLTAFFLFAVAALSDAVDGAMARTKNQITNWGKVYDPLADKLLVGSVAVILLTRYIELYIVALVLIIEILLIANAVWQIEVRKRVVQAVFSGKMKMVLQSFSILFIFIYAITESLPILVTGKILLLLSLIFGATSLFIYRSI